MATETLEERVQRLECKIQEVEERLAEQATNTLSQKGGWRSIVGIYANSPDFDDVIRIGEEWRNADRPNLDEEHE